MSKNKKILAMVLAEISARRSIMKVAIAGSAGRAKRKHKRKLQKLARRANR